MGRKGIKGSRDRGIEAAGEEGIKGSSDRGIEVGDSVRFGAATDVPAGTVGEVTGVYEDRGTRYVKVKYTDKACRVQRVAVPEAAVAVAFASRDGGAKNPPQSPLGTGGKEERPLGRKAGGEAG